MADARFTEPEMIAHSASAMRKIDARGKRGAEMVTHTEIVAMACLIHLMSKRMVPIQDAFANAEKV
ncbi:hypothetical protein SAMN04488527_101281 [Aliiroseovarius crassostreae]|uniref:Uncharacterized protein n=1 Tax=Aliiroseovarius crassostreae TaxID=154981 RepID=A0A0P7KK87_9RHOB|nr:hypothetical protein [Aliiroseovarius crassostreae]KPN64278.1 hypothetical protein AKJ29_16730 [Aliiroseovarius crassostreae]SFU31541.1 hypothetical protein SAMN04488527_101281 [Aliiroseovarius crassostreae]